MTYASVAASADVYVDWAFVMERMTHASVGADPWTLVQKKLHPAVAEAEFTPLDLSYIRDDQIGQYVAGTPAEGWPRWRLHSRCCMTSIIRHLLPIRNSLPSKSTLCDVNRLEKPHLHQVLQIRLPGPGLASVVSTRIRSTTGERDKITLSEVERIRL
jgi:hypothetical protein